MIFFLIITMAVRKYLEHNENKNATSIFLG
jgi:hypothetical protein